MSCMKRMSSPPILADTGLHVRPAASMETVLKYVRHMMSRWVHQRSATPLAMTHKGYHAGAEEKACTQTWTCLTSSKTSGSRWPSARS